MIEFDMSIASITITVTTNMLLWGSFVYALVCVVISAWGKNPFHPMGGGGWDPKQSWVSTATTIGAVLATVVSARPDLGLPEVVRAEFFGCSIFFGALILIAPLFDWGYVWSFLLSSFSTLWGAAGQIVALVLLAEMLKLSLAEAFQVVLLLTLLFFLPVYAWRSINMAIQNPKQQWSIL